MDNRNIATIKLPNGFPAETICGPADSFFRLIEESFDVTLALRDGSVSVSGDSVAVEEAALLLSDLVRTVSGSTFIDDTYVKRAIAHVRNGEIMPSSLRADVVYSSKGKAIHPKTAGQKRYLDNIRSHVITFGIGPAGTGKTYLAVASALAALNAKEVGRIVLSRPVVEAGESLGFLPGSLTEKVDPYMRPLYDALYDMDDFERINSLIAQGVIEIVPLAFMRGRTFNDCFIILDEAQNTTPEQMKMFLTRLGFGSKMVITGDATQIDLPNGRTGLKDIQRILGRVEAVSFCKFKGADVVRHPLVGEIVTAYERDQANMRNPGNCKPHPDNGNAAVTRTTK